MTKEEVKILLETQYPNHSFAWQERSGRLWGFCPEHPDKKTPNLNIFSPDGKKWLWYCFACGFRGPKDITPEGQDISLFEKYLKKNINGFSNTFLKYFQKRIPGLSEGENVNINDINDLLTLDIGAYSREIAGKIASDTIKKKVQEYKLDKYEWLVFIYRDVNLNPVSIKFRNISIPKYDPEWKKVGIRTIKLSDGIGFFNAQDIHSQLPFTIAVEGEFDAITTHVVTQGKYPVVAVSGTSGFTENMVKTITRTDKKKVIFILPDWDDAGQNALDRLVCNLDKTFLQENKLFTTLKAPVNGAKDMDAYLRGRYDHADDITADLFEEKNTISFTKIKVKKEKEREKELEKIYGQCPPVVRKILGGEKKSNRLSIGQILSTNFPETVSTFGVFYEGTNLLVSRGGIGKSFIMLFAAVDYAFTQKKRVLFISFEDYLNQKFKKDRIEQAIKNYADSINANIDQVGQAVSDYVDIDFGYENVFDKDRSGRIIETEYLKIFKEDIKRYDFIIIDPLISFIGIDELDSSLIRKALLKIRQIFIDENKQKIIVFTHHTNKNLKTFTDLSKKSDLTLEDYNDLIEMVRGTMETTNVIRNVVFALGHPVIKNMRRLVIIKSNIAAVGKEKEVITSWARADQYTDIENIENKTKEKKVYNFGGSMS